MKWRICLSGAVCVALVVVALPGQSQVTTKDSTIRNEYAFVSAHYFAPKGATNAVVTVRFTPGSRAFSGSVNYAAHDGTAVANEDYTPINGTLNYSGVNYRTFNVPLVADPQGQPKTILLDLSPSPFDPDPLLSRSNAVLHINLPPPPNLRITPGPNGAVTVCWPDDGTDVVLEKMTPPETTWSYVSPPSFNGQGMCSVTDLPAGGKAFYRLY